MATSRAAGANAKKQLALRNLYWPHAGVGLWQRTATEDFATVPKTMPMILKIMDEMTRGAPVSSTYFTLWCNAWDNSFVVLDKHGEMTNAAGFGGQRGEHTWATRMKKLRELQFIGIKPGKSGRMSNAIIWNPHFVLRWHYAENTPGMSKASYNALVELALDVGAKDMTDPIPVLPLSSSPRHPSLALPGRAAE